MATWTDERLDDLSRRTDSGFERVDRDVRELRTEMRDEFADVRAEMRSEFADVRGEMRSEFADVRGEMRQGFVAVRGEIDALRLIMLRVGGGIMIGLVGVIAAVFANGG